MSGASSKGNALINPMDSAGDMVTAVAGGSPSKIDSGAAGQHLASNGAASPTWQTPSNLLIENMSLAFSTGSNALTIALKGADGNEPSATNIVRAGFRTSDTDSKTVIGSITSANSLVVSAGSTLGAVTTIATPLVIWLFNDAGTFRLGISNGCLNGADNIIQSATSEGGAGAADSAGTIYSTAAISSKPCRILAVITGANTAGNWTATPTVVRLCPNLIPGIKDGSRATYGYPGEYLSNSKTAWGANSEQWGEIDATSTAWQSNDATGIKLTQGEWMISGTAQFLGAAGTTISIVDIGIGTSTTGGDTTGVGFPNEIIWYPTAGSTGYRVCVNIPCYCLDITTTTTYVLKAYVKFSGTCTTYGILQATRIR